MWYIESLFSLKQIEYKLMVTWLGERANNSNIYSIRSLITNQVDPSHRLRLIDFEAMDAKPFSLRYRILDLNAKPRR